MTQFNLIINISKCPEANRKEGSGKLDCWNKWIDNWRRPSWLFSIKLRTDVLSLTSFSKLTGCVTSDLIGGRWLVGSVCTVVILSGRAPVSWFICKLFLIFFRLRQTKFEYYWILYKDFYSSFFFFFLMTELLRKEFSNPSPPRQNHFSVLQKYLLPSKYE